MTLGNIVLLFGIVIGIGITTWSISINDWEGQLNRHIRSIELSAAHSLIADTKLPKDISPNSYTLEIRPNIKENTFTGKVKINVTWQGETDIIALHAHNELDIKKSDISIVQTGLDDSVRMTTTPSPRVELAIKRADHIPKKPIYEIRLVNPLKRGSQAEIEISFNGGIWDTAQGLFKGSYSDPDGNKLQYLATLFRPNNARRLFPCFDEPAYKVPFTVSIVRPKEFTTLFNTPLTSSEPLEGHPNLVVDHFETTPPMSTFTFGFVSSQLPVLNDTRITSNTNPEIKIYARRELGEALMNIYEKVEVILNSLRNYWGVDYPLCKLDIVALPNFSTVKPVDNWGLVVFKESELMSRGYYLIAQELVYQWLGSWATPYWWSDAHVNKAVAGFVAVSTALEIDNGSEFDGKWPMTVLYSIYYEFSRRYPHSKVTVMKQETTCSKTELVLRMLNYTLGQDTFKKGLQNFIADREYKTFFGDDIWEALTRQAHKDMTLCQKLTVNEIAGSWINLDRLPVVTVTRNYDSKTAVASQKVYLRERPHDVPEQDKMLWYIPLVLIQEDNLDFKNTTPFSWMKKVKEITLSNLPAANKFIIVNPEEIGPFPVNYDVQNWNLLAQYLQTKEGRAKIPIYTKAKLLHDAWNLAYGGHLNFATAFNMTLFMQHEKEHLLWNPIFTMIDHIGRHIDMSPAAKKFETYIRLLLTPLYEELGPVALENEENWKENLRSLSKTFLCRVGYRPCIEEAQKAYKKWMDSESPNDGNPVANQYICPVFKWGSQEEWEFGLERVINFPSSRIQSERTYLLKTLAGCPIQPKKIERLLNITVLEENGNFTETDITLIFSMLTGSNGYVTLFHFLSDHWDVIKHRFENKTNLWDKLVSQATGLFTTQEGYDMVSELYVQRQGEFASAEHIIEKSLKNIKEETKWSSENLPVIEKWLDNYLKTTQTVDTKFIG